MKDNVIKFKRERFTLSVRRKLFPTRTAQHWNRLAREIVQSPSLEIFKNHLNILV